MRISERKLLRLQELSRAGGANFVRRDRDMEADHAQGIAEGRLHPETRETLQDLWPDHRPAGPVGGQDRIVSRDSRLCSFLPRTDDTERGA